MTEGQSKIYNLETGNIGNKKQKKKYIQNRKIPHRKLNKTSNTDSTKHPGVTASAR